MEINKTTRGDIINIDPRNIVVVEGFNSRRDFDIDTLKNQIKVQGVLNPISVVVFKDENGEEKYKLVDGERRLRATLKAIEEGAPIMRIPALKISKSKTDAELFIEQLMRNEGKRFTDYENGIAFLKLRDNFKYTIVEISEKVYGDKTHSGYISNCIALLDLPSEIQEKLANNEISSVAVREIVKTEESEQEQVEAVNEAVEPAKAKGKTKATNKDIVSTKVKVSQDSMTIYKGIDVLLEYVKKYKTENGSIAIDLMDIYNGLKNKKSIVQILEEQKARFYADAM